MRVESIVRDNYLEISAAANEVGIDLNKSLHLIDGSGSMSYATPIEGKDKQKVSIGSKIYDDRTLVVNFHTFRNGGQNVSWKYTEKQGSKLSIDRFAKKRRQDRRACDTQKQRFKENINRQYIRQYQESEDWVTEFPYLKAKGLEGKIAVKKMSDERGVFIAIPIHGPSGDIVGLERIYEHKNEDGNQKFMTPGATKKNGFVLIGELRDYDDEQNIYLCEGWADAVTINLATDCPVFCAFDCGNLNAIADMIAKKHSAKRIVLATDDDRWNPKAGNAGMKAALHLSYHKQIKARKPVFDHLALDEIEKPKDFNDLYRLAGMGEVTKQLSCNKHESIIRAPRKAFEYNLKLLDYIGSERVSKQLVTLVSTGIRRNLSLNKLQIALAKKDISALKVQQVYDKTMRSTHYRSRKIHDIGKKSGVDFTLKDLKLDREHHGGYLINDSFSKDLEGVKGIIVVKSPMGSGKTERVIKTLLKESSSGVYLAHRVSLVEEACHRLGIMSYRGAEELDVLATRKMGVCVNSLNHPKFDHGHWFSDKETVFIDEASKVFGHLCGSTIDDPKGVMATFLGMLEVCPRVVICDADASDNLLELIHSMVPNREITVAMPVDAPMDHIAINLSTSFNEGYNKMKSLVAQGKNILIATDSKKEVKKIQQKLRKKGIYALGVYSESRINPQVEAWIKNPNAESHKYRVVIYNSCVDSGVSLVTEHFDETMGMFRGVVDPDTVMQMMGRNRRARDWFLVVNPVLKTRFGSSESEIYQAMLSSHCNVAWDEQYKKAVAAPDASDYDRVKIAMIRRKILVCTDYFLTLRVMLEQDGYRVEVLETEEKKLENLEQEMKEIGQEIQDEWVALIQSTCAPDARTYRKLKESYAISEEHLAEIVRYELEHTLCQKEISTEIVQFWLSSGMKKVAAFEACMSDLNKLREFDRHEITTIDSLTLRKNLMTKGEILQKLLEVLGVDKISGEGLFSHVKAQAFIDWLYEEKNRRVQWNHFALGSFLHKRPPRDIIKFIKEALAKMGLGTQRTQKTAKRLSYHFISPSSWAHMTGLLEARAAVGKHIAKIPEPKTTPTLVQPVYEPVMGDDIDYTWCACGDIVSERNSNLGIDICDLCYNESFPDDFD